MTILDKSDFQHKLTSVGVAPPFQEVRVVDEAGNDMAPGQVGEFMAAAPCSCPVTTSGRI